MVIGDPLFVRISSVKEDELLASGMHTVAIATTAKATKEVSSTSRPSCSRMGIRIVISENLDSMLVTSTDHFLPLCFLPVYRHGWPCSRLCPTEPELSSSTTEKVALDHGTIAHSRSNGEIAGGREPSKAPHGVWFGGRFGRQRLSLVLQLPNRVGKQPV